MHICKSYCEKISGTFSIWTRCILVSCSSSHGGHNISLFFINRLRYCFNVGLLFQLVDRILMSIIIFLRDSLKAYFESRMFSTKETGYRVIKFFRVSEQKLVFRHF